MHEAFMAACCCLDVDLILVTIMLDPGFVLVADCMVDIWTSVWVLGKFCIGLPGASSSRCVV